MEVAGPSLFILGANINQRKLNALTYWRNYVYTALQNLKVEYKWKGWGQLLHEQARKNPESLGFDPGATHSLGKCNNTGYKQKDSSCNEVICVVKGL